MNAQRSDELAERRAAKMYPGDTFMQGIMTAATYGEMATLFIAEGLCDTAFVRSYALANRGRLESEVIEGMFALADLIDRILEQSSTVRLRAVPSPGDGADGAA